MQIKIRVSSLVLLVITQLLFSVSIAATSENIVFESRGARLSGELFLPQDPHPIAAVVFVHGSGPLTRNPSLARILAARGIACLTYDKRGVGDSGGEYEGLNNASSSNLDLLAADAEAAYSLLKADDRFAEIPIGFAGISQAGWIIPIAAVRSPEVAFILLWSGPVVTASDELRFSAENEAEDEETRQRVLAYSEYIAADDTDPTESLSQLKIPGYWLFGGQDVSFSVSQSIEQLDELIAGGHDFKYQVFTGYPHLLQGGDDPRFESAIEWIKTIATSKQMNK